MNITSNIFHRIRHLLMPDEKRRSLRVVGAVFVCAVLDFAGLAALMPVLFYLLDEGGDKATALLFCLAAVFFILLKNVGVALLGRYQSRFLLDLYSRLSRSLFAAYYRRGLLFIRQRGGARLGHEVTVVCYFFSLNVLSPLLRMAGEVLLLLLVTVALLLYAPFTVLLLYAAFIPFMLFYALAVKKRVRSYGEQELTARREQARLVTETLRGYAELEVNAAFPYSLRTFSEGVERISENRLKLEMVGRLPLFLSELAVITGLTLLTLFGTGDVRAMAGVFAVAAFRLLPALRNILSGWTQIQNSAHCLKVVEEGLNPDEETLKEEEKAAAESEKEPLPFAKEIRMEGISYAYPEGKEVLHEFACTVRKGEYVGVRGGSGIGKTTLFNLLLGFLQPGEGRIWIDDTLLTPARRAAWHRRVGYVPQEVFVFDGTLAENIAPGCETIDRERVMQLLRQVRLEEWVKELPNGIDTPMGESGGRLSGGQRQRVGIARALYKGADVLLLDEATSSLDNETERAVNQVLSALMKERDGLTILTIAHRESTLAYCERVIDMEGKGEEG